MISVQQTVNNKMVEKLRSGTGENVENMLRFGLAPDELLDLVSPGPPAHATTRTIWFWSHQAPIAGGVLACWDWLDRKIQAEPAPKRAFSLAKMFVEAIEASAPEKNGETIAATWARALEWTEDDRAPGWTRPIMMSYLATTCAKLGNPSCTGLHRLERDMFVSKADWSPAMRLKYPHDPMTIAVNKGQVDLVELLLDMGCDPTMQDGKPIIAAAWLSFEQSFDKSQLDLVSELDPSALLFERLLERNLDWNVPVSIDKKVTVAAEAEKWLHILHSNPDRWEGVARQVEAKILGQKTVPSLAMPRASSKRRL